MQSVATTRLPFLLSPSGRPCARVPRPTPTEVRPRSARDSTLPDHEEHRRDCLVVDGEHCVAIVNIPRTIFGVIPFASRSEVSNGQIVSIAAIAIPDSMLAATTTPSKSV